jgi:tetratricopeptide (TPR) repeat protein
MAKIVQFNAQPAPEKFGLQRVRKRKPKEPGEKRGQLDLFSGGKVMRLNQLSPFEEALLLDEHGNHAAARQQYLKAIDESDSAADAYCNLGILDSQEGNYPKAIDCFTKALKENPRHYEAHYNLANLYAEVGNLGLAKVHYEIAIELEPGFQNCYFNLGLTLAVLKEYKQAVQILMRYRELEPDEDHPVVDDLIMKLSNL